MRPSIISSGQWDAVEPFIVSVRSNRDEYLPVEFLDGSANRFNNAVHDTLNYLGYEIELLYMIDMGNGAAELVGAKEGEAWLTVDGVQPDKETTRRGEENGAM